MSEDEEDRLKRIYYDTAHPAGFGSIQALANASRLSVPRVKKWLKGRRTYTLHKPARRRFPVRPYKVLKLDQQWQADLVEMIPFARQNDDYRYLITVIDVFSRYAWARPLKRKTPQQVIQALRSIFEADGRQPRFLQTDQGMEFENREVRHFLSERGIQQFSVKSQYKAALVERFNRTLKTKMWRVFTHRGNRRWIELLNDLVSGYNHSVHRMLRIAPADIREDNEVNVALHQYRHVRRPTRRAKFAVGDKVRLSKVKGVFAKGYLPNWTEEIFTVANVNLKYYPISYQVADHRGERIEGSFYDYELQPVDDSAQVYTVERVLRTRGSGVHKQYLVKWLGYNETSWVNASDFQQLT